VTARGLVTGDPVQFSVERMSAPTRVQAWAGPWPIEELWWDPAQARRVARFQVVGVDGSAWLLVEEDGRWWCEARYD
jgi:protein ImuB